MLGDPELDVLAGILVKFCRRKAGGRGGLSCNVTSTATALGISQADAKEALRRAATAAACQLREADALRLLLQHHAPARLEYPRAACPACGALESLTVKRLCHAAILTA
jgi:hypothetical protein